MFNLECTCIYLIYFIKDKINRGLAIFNSIIIFVLAVYWYMFFMFILPEGSIEKASKHSNIHLYIKNKATFATFVSL